MAAAASSVVQRAMVAVCDLEADAASKTRLQRRVLELQRLLAARVPQGLGVTDYCVAVLGCVLAANELGLPYTLSAAVSASGLSDVLFAKSLSAMRNALGLKPTLTPAKLAVQLGCLSVAPQAQHLLTEHTARVLASLAPAQQASADVSSPAYVVAAFAVLVKATGRRLDVADACLRHGIDPEEARRAAAAIAASCADLLPAAAAAASAAADALAGSGAAACAPGGAAPDAPDAEAPWHKANKRPRPLRDGEAPRLAHDACWAELPADGEALRSAFELWRDEQLVRLARLE